MKKITTMLLAMIVLATTTFAQPKAQVIKEKAKKEVAGKEKALKETAAKAEVDKKEAVKNSVNPAGAVKLKKDGTPDKRYKAIPAGPLKKDGTPDKRFKENKKG